ncbi:MAG: Sjogren's syndrome/scleroderma autoantigen 1 family protein [Candidatus Odinarchaeota archaeon]
MNNSPAVKSEKESNDKTAKREEDLKKLSRELLKGSVLLQEACPACNSPLVLRKGDSKKNMWCISCEKLVIRESEMGKQRMRSFPAKKAINDYVTTIPATADLDSLISIVTGKLESQIIKLAEEEDLTLLEARSKIAERLANLLQSLRNLND